jgi:hypothetical protein
MNSLPGMAVERIKAAWQDYASIEVASRRAGESFPSTHQCRMVAFLGDLPLTPMPRLPDQLPPPALFSVFADQRMYADRRILYLRFASAVWALLERVEPSDVAVLRSVIRAGYSRALQPSIHDLEIGREAQVVVSQTPERLEVSEELALYWKRGIEAHEAELKLLTRAEKESSRISLSLPALAAELADRVEGLIGIMGTRYKNGANSIGDIATSGRFRLSFQYEMLDRVPICPDESTDFFSLLYTELERFLISGGIIDGPWGRLVLENGTMRLLISRISDDSSRRPRNVKVTFG